jgi:hypothetical protein
MMDTVERRMVQQDDLMYYCDIPLGLFVVRGDSMVLTGQISPDDDNASMKQVTLEELEELTSTKEQLEWDFDGDLLA